MTKNLIAVSNRVKFIFNLFKLYIYRNLLFYFYVNKSIIVKNIGKCLIIFFNSCII